MKVPGERWMEAMTSSLTPAARCWPHFIKRQRPYSLSAPFSIFHRRMQMIIAVEPFASPS